MKFSVSSCYTTRGGYVLNDYPILKKYNAVLEEVERNTECFITINTLEELLEFSKDVNSQLIIDTNDEEKEIVIYDGYVE